MNRYHFTAIFEPQEEGGFTVTVPGLPGCISEGDTYEEARSNISEAIQSYLGSLVNDGEPLPNFDQFHHEVIAPIDVVLDPAKYPQSSHTHV